MSSDRRAPGRSAELVGESWARISTLTATVDAASGKWLRENHHLGLTEYRAVVELANAADHELRINDLAERVGLDQSSVTRLVGRLHSKGLAYRDVCADDRRGVYAVLTDEGLATVAAVREPYEAHLRDLIRSAATDLADGPSGRLLRAFDAVARLVG